MWTIIIDAAGTAWLVSPDGRVHCSGPVADLITLCIRLNKYADVTEDVAS